MITPFVKTYGFDEQSVVKKCVLANPCNVHMSDLLLFRHARNERRLFVGRSRAWVLMATPSVAAYSVITP